MDALEKLNYLSNEMSLEPTEEKGNTDTGQTCRGVFVYNAHMPNGKHIKLLKTLLSSACEQNCFYCPFRAGRNFQRVSFEPEEYGKLVSGLHSAGIIEGIFISSGVVGGGIHTQDNLIAAAEILRYKQNFRDYIHLKIMPGAEFAQVERSMQLADRVSINLEAPNENRLKKLAPCKDFQVQLWQRLQWIDKIRKKPPVQQGWKNRWPSTTTQFVVGSCGESDAEILSTTQILYSQLGLARAYYSPFRPFEDTPLQSQPSITYKREQRLYQASYLIRDYGFKTSELTFDAQENLPEECDPKTAWADKFLLNQPIEINSAEYERLLRIPGIGLKSAQIIIGFRKQTTIKDISTLAKMGINVFRANKYILINGHRPPIQIPLW